MAFQQNQNFDPSNVGPKTRNLVLHLLHGAGLCTVRKLDLQGRQVELGAVKSLLTVCYDAVVEVCFKRSGSFCLFFLFVFFLKDSTSLSTTWNINTQSEMWSFGLSVV